LCLGVCGQHTGHKPEKRQQSIDVETLAHCNSLFEKSDSDYLERAMPDVALEGMTSEKI
jgi:hypothetical protein